LLLGLPIAWVLARAAFRGRRLLTVLLAGPLLLPPFFAAMGVSTSVGHALAALGLAGGTLQLANAIVCLAGLLAPVPALLVGRALAAVPAGLVDAAVLAGGPRAARRGVVWPSVRPAVAASATLVFVVALTDFAVPDLLGVFLPDRATAVHVFATEIFLQWNRYGNVGRAVATGAPFVAIVFALLLVAFATLRRAPGGVLGGATRTRPRVAWTGARAAWPWLVAAPVLGLGLVLPIGSVMAWGFSPAKVVATVRETAGLLEDTERWVRLGLLTAFVATAVVVSCGARRSAAASRGRASRPSRAACPSPCPASS
jgi:ABC-type Fe3+ transport system permease subunit